MRRILVADDHTLFREALHRLLARAFPGSTIRGAASFEEIGEALDRESFDLVVMDLRMPGGDGIEMVGRVRAMCAEAKVVIVSGSDLRVDVMAALEAGAHGFIPKTLSGQEIEAALAEVVGGRIYVPAFVADLRRPTHYAEAVPPPAATTRLDLGGLTERQREVLRLLARGKSNKQIARELGLAESTVKIHLASVFRYLKVHKRAEAALIGAQLE